jgi:hypothetical protein
MLNRTAGPHSGGLNPIGSPTLGEVGGGFRLTTLSEPFSDIRVPSFPVFKASSPRDMR